MASRTCYVCGVRSHHREWGDPAPVFKPTTNKDWMGAFRCDECGALSIAVAKLPSRDLSPSQVASVMRVELADELYWIPPTPLGKDYHEAVPEQIASAASEAHECRSVNAWRAAILLSRSVIEATVKDQNITTGNLNAKIDTMYDKGLIRELVKQQAHEIRHLGNDMAHGDFTEPVTPEEADEILGLMDEVLDEVYESPARLKARQEAREAKKNGDSP